MKDIVERLRGYKMTPRHAEELCAESADEIETLRQQRDELKRIAEGINARMTRRGFYMPEDTADLIAALAKMEGK